MFNKEYTILADIGGTNSRLALSDGVAITLRASYKTADFDTATALFKRYIAEYASKQSFKIKQASISFAGSVTGNIAPLANADLSIDIDNLKLNTGIRRVVLMNDLETLGYSIDSLGEEDYTELTALGRNNATAACIIAAGTGLGTSILPFMHGMHHPVASEGGSIGMPLETRDKRDMELRRYLEGKKIYTCSEDLVSGKGIVNIYEFLLRKKVKHTRSIREEISASENKPESIMHHALEDDDPLCVLCLEIFIHYYAKVAQSLVLFSCARELFIGGGIAPKILPALKDEFIEEFVNHARPHAHELLRDVAIFVITNPDAVLIGCQNALTHKS